jgi:hypothetical protein
LTTLPILPTITAVRTATNDQLRIDLTGNTYNLVVDANFAATSTYTPNATTIVTKFCNDNITETLTNVWGHIGNYTAGTPGIYPVEDTGTWSDSSLPLYDTGTYSFSHMGGTLGAAGRCIGDLAPGACRVRYRHVSYPQCSHNETPPCTDNPVWGDSVKPESDLSFSFDVWDTAHDNDTTTSTITAAKVITSNGISYDFGNVNQDFDNDGDHIPDDNAWAQPLGDARYDPTNFRLIRTTSALTISRSAKPDLVLNFTDQRYVTDLPLDNNDVIGQIHYVFLALNNTYISHLSPYQEVASGSD